MLKFYISTKAFPSASLHSFTTTILFLFNCVTLELVLLPFRTLLLSIFLFHSLELPLLVDDYLVLEIDYRELGSGEKVKRGLRTK